jgi:prepilin-type N-terminal cleavage/methylation domain-containing protein
VTNQLGGEGGYSLIEMLIVMAILGIVLGGVVTLFTAGIKADSDQNQRFQSQQDTRLALDKLRRDVHGACTISNSASYNTWASSVTLYYPSGSPLTCASGATSITWCTAASGSKFVLQRVIATSCTGSLVTIADSLTSANVFAYIPPNSHLVTSTSVGLGMGSSYIATQDAAFSNARLHVDVAINRSGARRSYRLVDDIALRNSPRTCGVAVATC